MIRHTMIRVNDLDESIKFYCDLLKMKLLRKKEYPAGRFTLAFVGFGSEAEQSVLELTYNWDTHQYDPLTLQIPGYVKNRFPQNSARPPRAAS